VCSGDSYPLSSMTAVATCGNVLCTNYQQSGNALVPNQCYSSTPLEAAPADIRQCRAPPFGNQVQAKPSEQVSQTTHASLRTHLPEQHPISAAPTDYVHDHRLSTASASLDPDLSIPVAVSGEEGASREDRGRPRYRTPTPVAAVHHLLIAAPQHCAGHAATEAAQIRGLPGLAARSVQHSIAPRSCFFPVEVFWYVAVKKNSLHFPRKEKKLAIWWSAGLGDPRLGYFYFIDLSCVPRETNGF